MTTAKVIADSITKDEHRLTTMQVTMHRFVLAEFNTHRVFSRNSASSRAIPVAKQMQRVVETPANPVEWPREQKGMQGGKALVESDQETAKMFWTDARRETVEQVKNLYSLGVHKSITNRLLEPFMWHTVVVTSTAWRNFFGLRTNPMAQPEIRVAAEMMEDAYRSSKPALVQGGDWHLPYVDEEDWHSVRDNGEQKQRQMLVKVSSARCARVSYLTQEGRRSLGDDLTLYDRLTSADPMHASPLEHVATPAPWNTHEVRVGSAFEDKAKELTLPRYGNLLGWHSHRYDVEVERDYQAFA